MCDSIKVPSSFRPLLLASLPLPMSNFIDFRPFHCAFDACYAIYYVLRAQSACDDPCDVDPLEVSSL